MKNEQLLNGPTDVDFEGEVANQLHQKSLSTWMRYLFVLRTILRPNSTKIQNGEDISSGAFPARARYPRVAGQLLVSPVGCAQKGLSTHRSKSNGEAQFVHHFKISFSPGTSSLGSISFVSWVALAALVLSSTMQNMCLESKLRTHQQSLPTLAGPNTLQPCSKHVLLFKSLWRECTPRLGTRGADRNLATDILC
ncbi:hypothetical protein BDZ45DRAFT_389781 [Acephala macrosclerotiorum]|nr:hypothetical protein BDZ45DRAFT_389781 [Acephala macrosclerotiorum]